MPTLPQSHFVHLWKTLQDMFHSQPPPNSGASATLSVEAENDKLVHSVSVVLTSLLQIGEVGHRVTRSASGNVKLENKKLEEETDWSVTFQQFLACFLNESTLVDFFDQKIDLVEKLQELSAAKMQRQESVPLTQQSNSVFYV